MVTRERSSTSAAEIRRLASNEQVAAVFLPINDVLMGNRYCHPVYDAAQECGLPIYNHVGDRDGDFQPTSHHT